METPSCSLGAIGVFMSLNGNCITAQDSTAEEMQAKIGQLAMDVFFLAFALDRASDARRNAMLSVNRNAELSAVSGSSA
jgi:hypothetical protein